VTISKTKQAPAPANRRRACFRRGGGNLCMSLQSFPMLCSRRLPRLDIEVDVLHNIIGPGGVQGFIAGIHIVPHAVTGKEFRHLPACQVLGVFVGFHAINKKISLPARIHTSSGISKFPVFFSSSYILNKVSGLKCHSLVSSCSSIEYTLDS